MKKKAFAYTAVILLLGVGITGCNKAAEQAGNSNQMQETQQAGDNSNQAQETQQAGNSNQAQKTQQIGDNSKQAKEVQFISSSGKSYDTIENIFANMDNSLSDLASHRYENLKSNEKLSVEKPEHVGKAVMKIADNFNTQAETLFREYAGETYNKAYYSDGIAASGEKQSVPIGPEYDDSANKIHMGIADKGFFMYEKEEAFCGNSREEDTSFYLTKEYEDADYQLKDGKLKLSEIIAKADAEADKWEAYQDNISLKPYYVCVKKDAKTGANSFEILYQQTYGNVDIWGHAPEDSQSEEVNYNRASSLSVMVNSVNGEVSLTNQYNAEMQMQDEYDTIISFDKALELLDETVAGLTLPSIKKVGLEYMLSGGVQKQGEKVPAGSEYEAVPYWIMYFAQAENNYIYATVDCKTGEVKYYQNNQLVRTHEAVAD